MTIPTDIQRTHLKTRDLNSAWFELIELVLRNGRIWTVEHGSYEGQRRLEFDWVDVHVIHPGARPLIPEPPPTSNVPPPVDADFLEKYLPYLMTDAPPKDDETYTYGERVAPQMEAIIERFKTNGFGSNQECIAVARPEDIHLSDPPCLRQIDCRIFPSNIDPKPANYKPTLHFFVYFRSWDLFNGFPGNMAAIRTMQEYMAEAIGVEAGEIIATSKGMHLYDHVWDHAKRLVGLEDLKIG